MLDETENDGELLCRACHKTSDKTNQMIDLHSVETNFTEFHTISELFTKYTFLKIDENDEISTHICIECHKQLINVHKFREMCLATYYKLIKQKRSITQCHVPLAPVLNIKQEDPLEQIDSFEIYAESYQVRTKTEKIDEFLNYENNSNDSHEIYFSENDYSDYEMEEDSPQGAERAKRTSRTEIVCPICKVKKRTNFELKLHINLKHTKENRFKCEFCPRDFYEPNYVRKHRRDVHHIQKKNNNYICLLCNESFALSKLDKLRKHITTHKGIKMRFIQIFNEKASKKKFNFFRKRSRNCKGISETIEMSSLR